MTDEEKAEEQAKTYIIDLCAYCRECEKGRCSHTDDAIFGYKDGYKKGLAEGRKEGCEVCEKESNKEYQKLFDKQREIIERLEKENAEQKEKIKHRNCIDCSNHGKQIEVLKLKAQIEKMKCCENCKHSYTDSENLVFCYLPISQEECKSCRIYNHKETDNDYWELAE